ncbi:MAG: DUF368 domain-containing protein [Planctomycetaceae bacterium]
MTEQRHSWFAEVSQVPRGLLMGAADIVPGVSGGTVALILGIYERLVAAIGQFNSTFLGLVKARRWGEAARHVDLLFLVSLGIGIVLGMATFGGLIRYLLHHHLPSTLAAFFGLIAGSVVLVARMVPRWATMEVVLSVVAALLAVWIVRMPLLQNPPDALWYVFLCGVLGICAMILPGISGAFILLLLGKYREMVDLLGEAVHLKINGHGVMTLIAFLSGCAVGILSFSRFLKWLLGRHESQTLAALCGFMVGSLWKLWPFQRVIPGTEGHKTPLTEHLGYDDPLFAGEFWWIIGIMVTAMLLILLLDRLTAAHSTHPHLDGNVPD